MALKTYRVENLQTGLIHEVNEGHFSLDDPEYELVAPAPKKKAAPKKRVTHARRNPAK